ncbi:MAG TPA: DUF1501 domain-containing protein [Bryobacteraceae bacterium]|nr:DUF1501 domain-containing protein [Bryobacteraceae bacterium]
MQRTRRVFMRDAGIAMFGVGLAPGWLTRACAAEPAGSRKKVLVAIFQRGAVDGLNVVVPFGDKRYYDLRPAIGIPAPDGSLNAAVDLDGFFGLHPALAPLKPIYDSGQLAIVHAVGSPDPTRSHFDAQDYMESGTPGRKATADGWLNRALPPDSGPHSPVRAVSLGTEMARSLRGPNEALAVSNLNDFKVRDPVGSDLYESMYGASRDTALSGTARETFEAVKLLETLQKQPYSAANGAKYPNGRFAQSLQQIARLIKADVGMEVAFADVGGWDTHVNEVGATPVQGQLANLLANFGESLAAFCRDLGDRMADVTVVTMSEFGRTARENGNRGTDHGHANYMMALGGGIRGGKVYGEWPGLAEEQLYERRDLSLTTDFRDILSELVARHLGNPKIASVFPGYAGSGFRGLLGS